jgi:phytoene synthase
VSAVQALPSREAIVATAKESIGRGSKSFAAASRLFAPATRQRAWLLYAWCRACDDLADGQDHGHGMAVVSDPQARLALLTARTDAALAGQWVGDPAFDALRIVAHHVADIANSQLGECNLIVVRHKETRRIR